MISFAPQKLVELRLLYADAEDNDHCPDGEHEHLWLRFSSDARGSDELHLVLTHDLETDKWEVETDYSIDMTIQARVGASMSDILPNMDIEMQMVDGPRPGPQPRHKKSDDDDLDDEPGGMYI